MTGSDLGGALGGGIIIFVLGILLAFNVLLLVLKLCGVLLLSWYFIFGFVPVILISVIFGIGIISIFGKR